MDLGLGGNDVTQQRLGTFHVDGEIVVDKEDGNLPFFRARTGLKQKQLIHHALVAAEANGISKETGDGAELATVGTTPSRFHRNDAKATPAFADLLEQRVH